MTNVNLRSGNVLFSLDDITFHQQDELVLDGTKLVQLPSHRFVIERYYSIRKNDGKTVDGAAYQVANELIEAWIYCNVCAISRTACKYKVSQYITKTVDALKKCSKSRLKSQKCQEQLIYLNQTLENGFDIRCDDKDRVKALQKAFNIKMSKPEEDLWKDNCVPNGNDPCIRKMWCGGDDKEWCKAALKRRERSIRKQYVNDDTIDSLSLSESDDMKSEQEDDYVPPVNTPVSDVPVMSTRQQTPKVEEIRDTSCKLRCRDGYRSMNPDLMVVLGLCVSKFGVSENKVAELVQLVVSLCGAVLQLPSKEVLEMEDEEETEEREEEDEKEPNPKKRKSFGDLTYTLPGPRTIHKWIEDQAILSLWHAADEIKLASSRDAVVTLGWDDTVKKAGHHRHDIKAGHVTIVGTDKVRSTYSTGLYENLSHSGKYSAETVEMVLGNMAALTGISRNEFFSFIDFWINDRAGDNILMLDELGVESEKRLFCNAHVLLTIDEAIDSCFLTTETKAGKARMISKDAGHVFSSPKNSIFYLGLIALSKLLSDSHCTETISLYKDYKKFLSALVQEGDKEASEVVIEEFKGFRSNRFGRVPYLSGVILIHAKVLKMFFDNNVDENGNKLVLACYSFLNSPWFLLCCKVCARFKTILVDDILSALGIDKFKSKKSPYRSWAGMKVLFAEKLTMLQDMGNSKLDDKTTGFDLLLKKCASAIHLNVRRQLDYMSFFSESVEIPRKETRLLRAPMTNDGCESELATCGETIKKVGSTVSLSSISDRHLIVRNKLFENQKWKSLTLSEKRQYMRWSRNSKEAKLVKEKGKEYLQKVKAAVNVQLDVKAQKKKKKINRSLQLLEKLKAKGGPVTENDTNRLDSMCTADLLDQIAYLRCSIAPDIRQKRKVGNHFVQFTDDELRRQITDVIKPSEEMEQDIDSVVMNAWHGTEEIEAAPVTVNVGTIGIWKGSFDRQCVGVQVTEDKVQLFRKTVKKGYYTLNDIPETGSEWILQEIIPESDYEYVEFQNNILLKLYH